MSRFQKKMYPISLFKEQPNVEGPIWFPSHPLYQGNFSVSALSKDPNQLIALPTYDSGLGIAILTQSQEEAYASIPSRRLVGLEPATGVTLTEEGGEGLPNQYEDQVVNSSLESNIFDLGCHNFSTEEHGKGYESNSKASESQSPKANFCSPSFSNLMAEAVSFFESSNLPEVSPQMPANQAFVGSECPFSNDVTESYFTKSNNYSSAPIQTQQPHETLPISLAKDALPASSIFQVPLSDDESASSTGSLLSSSSEDKRSSTKRMKVEISSRKDRNRLAAKRLREKRKGQLNQLFEKEQELIDRNKLLERKIQLLKILVKYTRWLWDSTFGNVYGKIPADLRLIVDQLPDSGYDALHILAQSQGMLIS